MNFFLGLLSDKLLDDLLEGFKWLAAHQGSTINNKAWSALHTNLPGKTGFLLDNLGGLTCIQAVIECFHIQS